MGEAFIPDLGGCRIGDRPIDFHLEVLRKFGAVVDKTPGGIRLSAPQRLRGTKVKLPYPSVGATEQVLLTAVRAEGVTELRNAVIEPEIIDLVMVLQKMGASITVDPARVLRIEGVDRLQGYVHRNLPDRNEAASWASAALAMGGDITVAGARQQDMITFLNVFRQIGGEFDVLEDGIRFRGIRAASSSPSSSRWTSTRVLHDRLAGTARPRRCPAHPGTSIIHETVYENRFGFTDAYLTNG